MTGVITGPVPPFSNPPIEPQYFAPWKFDISNITLGLVTIVTMVIPSITTLNYVVGQQVRLLIPPTFGCRELNGQTAYVIGILLPNEVVLELDSSMASDFISSSARTPPQILAIGDVNSGPINTMGRAPTGTFIPGSFLNISPN